VWNRLLIASPISSGLPLHILVGFEGSIMLYVVGKDARLTSHEETNYSSPVSSPAGTQLSGCVTRITPFPF
jgi:hypothetical protein